MVISGLESMYRYEYMDKIGSGSYGNVYKALDKQTGEIVAMKHEIRGLLSKSSFREINILQSLPRHPSMVEFKDVIMDGRRDQVYIVMEYLETDLKRYINLKEKSLGVSEVKSLMKQLLEGVKFLHENGVMHRDLKPSNLLMNGDQLKICDFGLSREFGSKSGSYTPGVGTRWYRAPELLIHGANKYYSSAIDMWSVGCIMAELVLKEVLFKGGSEIDQLSKIHRILGSPNHDVASSSSSSRLNLLRQMILGDTSCRRAPGLLTELGFDLLSKLLAYDPNERITAEDALRHGWFVEFDSYSCSEFDSILDYYRLVLYRL
ncbi:hypothetical protein BUALT_Bualt18G0085300 [Buddleja alternifolia]|uniref:Protein kinase domain-containing protein n=1 Tax=Buddleja alternifolia TaxID=168488 RepID=A0AAV6W4L2_9LAMI|nr:hypothetical protein BUALT_Bualt18G0085300 [Buddleja alternifolia]